MKLGTSDKVSGTIHTAMGSVKEIAGTISDNPKLEGKGKIEKFSGQVQNKIGEIEQVLGK